MAEAVVIAKPDAHRREYSFLQLENGLKVVVGSDASCDKAGAALCVNVGSCHERQDLPGLAHFLEHMLFTGTKKYPKEGEYHEFIQQNGGMANAYTTCYFTNYMFEVKPEALESALDRFAGFFADPLLTKDCVDREINAVDSEFQGGYTEPWWRYIGIMNMSANPEHPFHISVGNNKVLRDEPKEKGLDLYEEMIKFYNANYSANGMTLCIIGKESRAELEAMIKEKFGPIADKKVTMPIGDTVSDKPPFLQQDWNRLLLQTPVKDIKELVFSWVIPYQDPLWKSKPSQYISHILGYEGEGSIIAVLKQQGLITGCSAGNGSWLEGAFSLINLTFELTDKGLGELKTIGTHVFAYIAMLQKTPVAKWLWDELAALQRIQFKFGEDMGPFDLCQSIALSLQKHPPTEALAADHLLYEYEPEGIQKVLSLMTLDKVRVSHQAKSLSERCTDKDTSYESPMKFEAIDPEWLKEWGAAVTPGDGSPDAAIKACAAMSLTMPNPNPFIPEDLSVKELDAKPTPIRLQSAFPENYLFHRQDDVFKQPKAHVIFNIRSPFLFQDVESYVKCELWTSCVTEALSEYSYDAQVAGVSFALQTSGSCVALIFGGFNDKLAVLLKAVSAKMRSMVEVPETIYEIVADAYLDDIRNRAFCSPPYSQCGMRFEELTKQGVNFPAYKRYEAFQNIKREDLTGIPDKLLGTCNLEAMVLGNMRAGDAQELCDLLSKELKIEKSMPSVPHRAEAAMPDATTIWSLDSTDDNDPNHAVFMRIQVPESVENEMNMALLDKVLGAKFFDVLRTQQQLGYIVQMGASPSTRFSYLIAVVQSEFPPDYCRSRIEEFFVEHFKFVEEELKEEEFCTCRDGVLSQLKMKPKNLGEEWGRYGRAFSERTFDFARRERCTTFVESATLEGLRAFVKDKVRVAPKIFTQVKKVMKKDDKELPEGATVPEDPSEIRKWNSHVEVVKSFGDSATWMPFNCEVEPLAAAGKGSGKGYAA